MGPRVPPCLAFPLVQLPTCTRTKVAYLVEAADGVQELAGILEGFLSRREGGREGMSKRERKRG